MINVVPKVLILNTLDVMFSLYRPVRRPHDQSNFIILLPLETENAELWIF